MIDPVDYFFTISIPSTLKSLTPDCFQITSIVVTVITCVGLLAFHRNIKRWKRLLYACVFTEYLILLVYITLWNRVPTDCFEFEWRPFWSYQVVGEKLPNMALEVILNVLLFIPLGILLACQKKLSFDKSVLIGVGISAIIELLQLVTKRGLCETDDVIHNCLGLLIGLGLCWLFKFVKNKI